MIFSAINIDEQKRTIVVLVIEKENLARMKQGDPITIMPAFNGGLFMKSVKYPTNMGLLIAYSEEDFEVVQAMQAGDLLQFLTRGMKFDPKTDGKENHATFTPKDDDRQSVTRYLTEEEIKSSDATTHWRGCWKEHRLCALIRIARLENDLHDEGIGTDYLESERLGAQRGE